MVIALIAIGVIAFLAIDAYVIVRVFRSRASRDDYGMFMVPGESTVTVPAGKLKVSYQEEYKASSDGDYIDFGVPGQLQVAVTNDATGEQMEIKGPASGHGNPSTPAAAGAARWSARSRSRAGQLHGEGRARHRGRRRAEDPARQVARSAGPG